MSRTHRKVPHGIMEESKDRFFRGLVNMPVRKKDVDGWLFEEVWKRKAKKWVKRFRNKKIRRQYND